MSRYRLLPSPTQEAALRDHCVHARFIWNLAVEQYSHWHPGRKNAPGYLAQCRQLTAARAAHPWASTSIARQFDVDVFGPISKRVETKTVTIPFTVR